MNLVPDWAPNIHPLLVHFPIALLSTAAAADVVGWAFQRNKPLRQFATLLYVPRLGSATPTTGLLWELEAIASVIVGGTALKGGSGSIVGTVVGAILLSVIGNILNLTSIISVYLNAAVQGGVIIVVAFMQRRRR